MRKGLVFTTDILIGSTFVILILLIFAFYEFESILPEKRYEKLTYIAEDTMDLLTNWKARDIQDKPTVNQLIEDGVLTERDLDKSVLDLIASFWYAGNKTIARNISEEVLEGVIKDVCVDLTVDGETIFNSSCPTLGKEVAVATRIESGYEPGKPTFGYIARAFLTGIRGKRDSSYAFFGGYVGDGNITRDITLYSLNEVLNATMVLDVGDDFDLYINSNKIDSFSPTPENLTADEWVINSSDYHHFHNGNNTIQFNFTGNESRIGGGYFKVTYSSSQFLPTKTEGIDFYYFPGIEGIINLYSSFYVPGDLNTLEVYLHYKSDYEAFFSIGNATIYEKNATGEENEYISDDDVKNNLTANGLSYTFLSNKTIPIRMGLSNVSYVTVTGGNADVFSVTDVSGSMNDCVEDSLWCDYDCCVDGICPDSYSCQSNTCIDEECESCSNYPLSCTYDCCFWFFGWVCPSAQYCESPTCTDEECGSCGWMTPRNHQSYIGQSTASNHNSYIDCVKTKLDFAKEANYVFVDAVLNVSGNKVGLVNYSTNVEHVHPLSTDNTSLKNEIDGYTANGWTCICCGVNRAAEELNLNSPPEKFKSIVVMTDGKANRKCDEQGTNDAREDAVQSACDAYNNYGITVYTVGYGDKSDINETTLQRMADCGHGKYYYSDVTELSEIYQEIAEEILNASYVAQTVKAEGEMNNTILYPDSYIRFTYDPITISLEYGEITLTRETDRLEDCFDYVKTDDYVEGGYYLPGEVEVIDAKVASYSSQFWTHKLDVNTSSRNWQRVYQLSDYGSDYRILGDAYIVQIPVDIIGGGENNYVRVETGINPENATGGSPDDRVIYTMAIEGSVGYGNVFDTSVLAREDARERLIDKISSYVDVDEDYVEVQNETIGGIQGLWGPSLLKIVVWKDTTI